AACQDAVHAGQLLRGQVMTIIAKIAFSFPGSAWERTAREAPPREAEPRVHWVPRQSLGTRGLGNLLKQEDPAFSISSAYSDFPFKSSPLSADLCYMQDCLRSGSGQRTES